MDPHPIQNASAGLTIRWRIRLLGEFRVEREDEVISRFRTQKTAALLAYLAHFPERNPPREKLIDLFWPDADAEAGRVLLNQTISLLRRRLEPPGTRRGSVLISDRQTVHLNLAAVTTDSVEFEASLRDASDATDPREKIEIWSRAVDLYQGELLPGFYEEWIPLEALRLEEAFRTALRKLIEGLEEVGDLERGLLYARRWVTTDPGNEAAHRRLMRLLARSGDPASALRHYQGLERYLKEAGEEGPSDATRRLVGQIQKRMGSFSDPSEDLAFDEDLPPSTPISSDLTSPSPPILEVTSSVSPAPPSSFSPHNLPRRLTSFIGRKREIETIRSLLERTPLLTLTGAGGSGKSRLALETARWISREGAVDFPDDIWLVELAPLSDASLVPQAVASALGIPETPGAPLLQALEIFLASRTLLLILDNCEHLIEACAALAYRLLPSCPGLKILATSRETLRVEGETIYPVPTLSFPLQDQTDSPEDLLEFEAILLFRDRARSAQPSFRLTDRNMEAVAWICRQLDGIPLALELAAARVKIMTVEQISERLEDRFSLLTSGHRSALPRHRTLKALIDWSYELLPVEEKTLLRRFSVFAGGWTLEAAEAVGSGDPIEEGEVLEGLSRLVEKSLVAVEAEGSGAVRYRMLETIRQYALDRLKEAGEEETARDRHLGWFLAFAEAAEIGCRGPQLPVWLDRLEADADNLRSALGWSLPKGEDHMRLTAALSRFWLLRDHIHEGIAWLDGALLQCSSVSPHYRARLLEGRIRCNASLPSPAFSSLMEAAIEAYREAGEVGGTARCLAVYARDHSFIDKKRAIEMARESIEMARALPDRWTLYEVLYRAAWALNYSKDDSQGLPEMREALAVAREIGDPFALADTWDALSWYHYYKRETEPEHACLRKALPFARASGVRSFLLYLLGRLSRHRDLSHPEDIDALVESLPESIEAIREMRGNPSAGLYLAEMIDAIVKLDRLEAAERGLEALAELKPDRGRIRAICLAQLGLARLALRRGETESARRRLKTALEVAQTRGGLQALMGLADVAEDAGRLGLRDTVLKASEEVLASGIVYGDLIGVTYHYEVMDDLLKLLGRFALKAGDFSLARHLFSQGVMWIDLLHPNDLTDTATTHRLREGIALAREMKDMDAGHRLARLLLAVIIGDDLMEAEPLIAEVAEMRPEPELFQAIETAHLALALLANMRGENAAARSHIDAGLRTGRAIDDGEIVPMIIKWVDVVMCLGRVELTWDLFTELVSLRGPSTTEKRARHELSDLVGRLLDYPAFGRSKPVLERCEALDHEPWAVGAFVELRWALSRLTSEEGDTAARELHEAEVWRLARTAPLADEAIWRLGYRAQNNGEYEDALILWENHLMLRYKQEDLLDVAATVVDLGVLAWLQGRPLRAARLFGAAEVMAESLEPAFDLFWGSRRCSHDAAIRAALGEAAFATALAEGRSMTREEAIAYALEGDTTEVPL